MKIQKITIRNILGIESLEFSAGRFTKISGKNGTGKTSVLEAIKSIFKGGSDATLLRNGAEKGETVILLDDGTQISKRVTESGSTTTALDPAGRKIAKPTDVIKSLTDMLSVNPVDFLRATKKERVAVLLESMPIEIDRDRVHAMCPAGMEYDFSVPALETIEKLRRLIYDTRTGTNRAVKEKHATINQLAATLPDHEAGELQGAEGILEQINALTEKRDAEFTRIDDKLSKLRSESQAKIDALRQQIDDEKAALTEIESKAAAQRQKTADTFAASTRELRDNLAAIQESQKQAAKHQQTRDTIRQMREHADSLQAEADAQTKALEDLEAYKSELLASLPIPGLTVVDGEIYRDGVQFDRLNTQQQVQIAVEIAKLRAGELGVIVVDGLELLDSDKFDEFKQQAIESGLQLLVTRVSDDDFSITTE